MGKKNDFAFQLETWQSQSELLVFNINLCLWGTTDSIFIISDGLSLEVMEWGTEMEGQQEKRLNKQREQEQMRKINMCK